MMHRVRVKDKRKTIEKKKGFDRRNTSQATTKADLESVFTKYGIAIGQKTQLINPAHLANSQLNSKDYSKILNLLDKSVQLGMKGLIKSDAGNYILVNDQVNDGPSLSPAKDWEYWNDYHQRDAYKAIATASIGAKGPTPSLQPSPKDDKENKNTHRRKEERSRRAKQEEEAKKSLIEQEQRNAIFKDVKLRQDLKAEMQFLNSKLKAYWNTSEMFQVGMKYRKEKNQHPLKSGSELSSATYQEYTKIANRLEQIHPQQITDYLAQRADCISRQTWWKEHAVARRMLRGAELNHFDRGETLEGKMLAAIRQDVQKMDYRTNRNKAPTHSQSKRLSKFSDDFYKRLVEHTNKKRDLELHDALVVTRNTGLRPEELQHGISLKVVDQPSNIVAVDIAGAKKSTGVEGAPARYQDDHGRDRSLLIESKDLADIAERHDNFFKPSSSKEALRMRLNRATTKLDPNDEMGFSFYTLRHQAADELRQRGLSEEKIALHMGHNSQETQKQYGIKNA